MAFNTSSGYKEVIYSGDSNNKLLLKFNNVELENADIYCERITVKSSILKNGTNVFSLENFISKEVEIVLHDVDINNIIDQVYIAIGTFVGSAYEYVPIGIFNIQDKPTTDGNKITITLRDNSVKFDFNYNAQPLFELHGGTATKLQILQDMCIIAGVECDITSFLGSNDFIGIYDSSITARKYVSYIAGQAGMIPTIDRDGKLIFININSLTTKIIPLNIVEKYESGIPYKISKTIYESGIVKYESGTNDNDILYLDSANPYITTQGQVDLIHSLVSGFEIDSFKTGKILGDPSIDSYDLISIIDGENTYTTLATNTLVYQKSMIQTFDTQISLEARETNVSINSDATFKKYAKTNIDNINAQIEIIAGEVIDLSANVNGLGNVILTNCSKTPLYKLVIKNACQLFPSVNLFPSSTLYPLGRYLRITHEDNTYERYLLPILSLRTYNGVSDELIVENNKLSIIKRVGVNADESFYVLTTPITTTYDDIFLYLNEGTNTIWLESFPNATLEVTYLLKNKYTNVFATQADVSAQITVSSEQINLEVAKKVDEDKVISTINVSTEGVKIKGENVDITGTTSFNNNVIIETDGTLNAKNGIFQGDVTADNLFLNSGGKVISGDGLLTNLQYTSSRKQLGQSMYSYEGVFIQRSAIDFDVYIPANFVVESAFITVYVLKTKNSFIFGGPETTYENYGKVQNIRLYKNTMDQEIFNGWLGTFNFSQSLVEIPGAFGENGFTASTIEKSQFNSIDIKDSLIQGETTNLTLRTADEQLNIEIEADVVKATQQTQIGYAIANIIGYMSYE